MTRLTFTYRPPADDSVDGEWVLLADGLKTGVSIQDGRSYGAGYSVNFWNDANKSMRFVHTTKSLPKAKELALALYNEMRKPKMRDNLSIVKSLLSKTVARGATEGEEASAVAKAVEMMGKYAIPHSAVASVWPRGWAFDGSRAPTEQRVHVKEERVKSAKPSTVSRGRPGTLGSYARDLLMRHYPEMGAYTYSYILSRIHDRYPGSLTTIASLRWYESQLRKEGKSVPKRDD